MKKRINLFSQRNENQTAQKYLQYGKRTTYWVLLFGVLFLMALFGTYFWFNRYLSELKNKKDTYNRYILTNKEFNQEIKHFVNKFSLLKTYLASDAAGYAYYKHLKSIIKPSGAVDTIDSFTINNLQVVSFSLPKGAYGTIVLKWLEAMK